jgi:two-component system, chemotaxis family, chemotaxis protein CheY
MRSFSDVRNNHTHHFVKQRSLKPRPTATDAEGVGDPRRLPSPGDMGFSVLICDDVPAVQPMMRRLLEREGLTVSGLASTADEALAMYAERTPDVVLLDLNMPGAHGLGLLTALRELDPTACVVICSGAGDEQLRAEAHTIGAAEWVLKPIFTTSLVALLRDVVTKSQLVRSARNS